MNIKAASCYCHEVWNYTRQEIYITKATGGNVDFSRLELQFYVCVYHVLGSSWHHEHQHRVD